MREIETRLVLKQKDIRQDQKAYTSKLEYLFKNPEFFKQVRSIRAKFDIPAYGIKDYQKNFELFARLSFEDEYLKTLGIKKTSKYQQLQKYITSLIENFELPERFRYALQDYVLGNKFPTTSSHLSRCCIRVYDDEGQKRVFIEVFGDTQKEDLVKAWPDIKSTKTKYGIKGGHLFRYENFFRDKLIESGQKPVDKEGDSIEDDELQEMGYEKKNVSKYRYRRAVNNSKS